MNNEQLKEHIVNNIKELKHHIIIIENLLKDFRTSFLYHYPKEKEGTILKVHGVKDGYPYFIGEEVKSLLNKFNDNLPDFDFIKKEISKITLEFIHTFTCYSEYDPNPVNTYIYKINTLLPLTCNKIIEQLILKILIKEKNIKFYENLIELYPEKPEIENIMDLYPEKPEKPEIKNKQYSMSLQSLYVIFLIIIVFYIITVIMLINHNNSTIRDSRVYPDCTVLKENTRVSPRADCITQLDHPIQCIMPTFINKHNQLKDLMII